MAFSLILTAVTPLASAGTYQLDDGTVSAGGLGRGYFGALTSVWLDGFQAQPGMETITTVSVMFGAAPIGDSLPVDGSAVTILLYTDPNNDGNPLDGVLQRQVAGTVQSADTGTFVDFAIPSITLTSGNWFFVGLAAVGTPSTSVFGPNIDSEDSSDPTVGGPSYHYGWFSGTPDIAVLSGSSIATQTVLDSDFMIRATGVADADVPEPATHLLAAFALATLCVSLRRRR